MFKNAVIYKLTREAGLCANDLLEGVEPLRFVECGATQKKAAGWIPPRGHEHGALVEVVAGHYFLRLMVETKVVPSQVLKRRTEEQIKRMEEQTGRKPGKRHRKEISEGVELELLPLAFSKRTPVSVWIDPGASLLIVDAASASMAEDAVSLLVKAVDGLQVRQLETALAPSAAMTNWLLEGAATPQFSIDRDCELRATDEIKSVVRYGRHLLDSEEVKAHLRAGKRPSHLGMTWESRVSFVLTDRGTLKRVAFLDVVFEKSNAADDGFDSEAVIVSSELSSLIGDLVQALGGEDVNPGRDPLYDQAVTVVRAGGTPSISALQSQMQIGYNRAARLLEEMEKMGVVSAIPESGGGRTLLPI